MMIVKSLAELSVNFLAFHSVSYFAFIPLFFFVGLIMVLAGASEFDPQYNKDATSRPVDNIQIPQVRYS